MDDAEFVYPVPAVPSSLWCLFQPITRHQQCQRISWHFDDSY
jgi:hypothetical protein